MASSIIIITAAVTGLGAVALVTGGMGGLGEAICIKLAALGYKVVTTHSPGNNKADEWLDAGIVLIASENVVSDAGY